MPEPTRRLFFALWPDAATRQALDEAGRALAGKRVRRVPPANLHLTLAFAGSVSGAVQDCLEAAAETVTAVPFELTMDCAGHWPQSRILWLGPADTPPALVDLAASLRWELVSCGLAAEPRAFQAHVTIARRFSQPLPQGKFPPVVWSIGDFRLVESVTAARGVRYVPLRRWMLEGRDETV